MTNFERAHNFRLLDSIEIAGFVLSAQHALKLMPKRQCFCIECEGNLVSDATYYRHKKANKKGDQIRQTEEDTNAIE
jgi:hypothetical protein